jgi:phosphopantothenoylcysteine decarboxylase/phosphopantothenate--cysteine ligase
MHLRLLNQYNVAIHFENVWRMSLARSMARILITSGPTRQYLDPVRYLTNASSGRMGRGLAEAALAAGHEVVIVSGPVEITYPAAARVIPVVTTDEMLEASRRVFPECDGVIGVAAPCDYRPVKVAEQKIAKTGAPLELHLIETPDVIATLGRDKEVEGTNQWLVGFALETDDRRYRALMKLQKKNCDLVVLNGPEAMNAMTNEVELLDRTGAVVATFRGEKDEVARSIFDLIAERLIR